MIIIPFSTNVPLLYPIKTSEMWRFSDVLGGYKSGTLVENGYYGQYISKTLLSLLGQKQTYIQIKQ